MNENIVKREDNPKVFYFNFDLMSIIEVLYIFVLILSIIDLVQKIRKSGFAGEK